MDKIGIGIIGCGYWGINYVRVFNQLAHSYVALACDQRTSRLQEVARQCPSSDVTTDMRDVLASKAVDAVIVCTEATSHFDVVKECLAAGKHVLVEKPMTTSSSAAEELISLAESKKRQLMVGHVFLYNAGVRKLKSYVEKGDLGQIYYLYSRRTNLGPIRKDVNALWDLATHDISIFDYLLNSSPLWVSTVGTKVLGNGCEDVGFIALGYANNVVGHAHLSWVDPHKEREVVVVGSDKRIVFDDLNVSEPVRVFEKGIKPAEPATSNYGEFQYLMRDGDIIIPKIVVSEPLKNQCEHFLECIQEGKRPLTDGQNGLEIVRVLEAADRSMALRGAPTEVK